MNTRWEQFKQDYPEMHGFIKGYAANSIEFSSRLSALIGVMELVSSIPASDSANAAPQGDKPRSLESRILEYLNIQRGTRTVASVVAYLYRETSVFFSSDEVELRLKIMLTNGQVEYENHNGVDYYRYKQPATSTPDAGEYFADGQTIYAPNGNILGGLFYGADSQKVASLLNTETAALREQLAASQAALQAATIEHGAQDAIAWNASVDKLQREVDTMQDRIDDLNHMVDEARLERDSLKAQLAECQHAHELASTQRDAASELYSGKHSRLEELKRDLEVSRDARKALEKVIKTAATYLAETNSNDENVGRAYNVLQGFGTPDTED